MLKSKKRMHPRTRQKTKDITRTILELLLVTSGLTIIGILGQGRGADKLVRFVYHFGKWRIRETLKRLRLQNYVQYTEGDIESPIRLTEKGRKFALQYHLHSVHTPVKGKRWDYLWRVVMFDIPERKKTRRDNFQVTLVNMGLYQLQRSIFVTPFPCEKEIVDLCACWRVQRYAVILLAASLGDQEMQVRKHFFGDRYKE